MAEAIIRDYGTVEFDPMTYSNNVYDLYDVAVCDPETDLVDTEEHYTDEDDFRSALKDTYGREVMDEQEVFGWCEVVHEGCTYECECVHHVAYVIDNEEE